MKLHKQTLPRADVVPRPPRARRRRRLPRLLAAVVAPPLNTLLRRLAAPQHGRDLAEGLREGRPEQRHAHLRRHRQRLLQIHDAVPPHLRDDRDVPHRCTQVSGFGWPSFLVQAVVPSHRRIRSLTSRRPAGRPATFWPHTHTRSRPCCGSAAAPLAGPPKAHWRFTKGQARS